jgi:hypothetical protein
MTGVGVDCELDVGAHALESLDHFLQAFEIVGVILGPDLCN